jgi:hypothetical protein
MPRLVTDGLVADGAFVDGSHDFHNVFVDLFFLSELVRPGGLVIIDDHHWPSVATAARYSRTTPAGRQNLSIKRRDCARTACRTPKPNQASRPFNRLALTRRPN